jgi:endoglucanase
LMKGFLHQRSGIELGPPYTNYQRPRNMHTHDDFIVHKCNVDRFFNPMEKEAGVLNQTQSGVFVRIQASILMDTEVKEAWGGWMDAGDFDQRMSHLFSVRRMMYLYEINPGYFESLHLNIPESSNNIPDILDEGAWCLDLYRRTQGVYDEGGISWWVESIEHPKHGESSWLNSLPTALIPPTPRAGLHYATAAQMSLTVRKYDPELSREYLESALAAVKWVDKNSDAPDPYGSNPRPVIEALAYVSLYRATGNEKWHQRFIKKTKEVFPDGIVESASIRYGELYATYLLIKNHKPDTEITEACEKVLITLADRLLEGANQNTFDIPKMPDEELGRMVTLGRKILPIVMAHWITKDKRYTDALCKTMQYTMGANPMNRTYISGLGERTFMPYHHDWEIDNLHIPSGIPNFGPTIQTETRWGWRDISSIQRIEDTGLYPNKLMDWPFVEKCFNNLWVPNNLVRNLNRTLNKNLI